ncbi:MAG: hypothetical protein JNM76_01865 [Betaproteobacteria bacterium]|nr:hypothetical protein [Betaproteobacteria bacterium]
MVDTVVAEVDDNEVVVAREDKLPVCWALALTMTALQHSATARTDGRTAKRVWLMFFS